MNTESCMPTESQQETTMNSESCMSTESQQETTMNSESCMSTESQQETTMNSEICMSTESQQEIRTFLRERFLRAMAGIVGQECQVHMFDNTDVAGIFRGVDVDLSSFLVSQLKTPIGIVPEGILRASDTIWLHFPDIVSSQKGHEENKPVEDVDKET